MKLKQIKRLLEESEWKLGILLNGFDDLKENRVKWISNGIYKNKWFADPFILDFDDKQVKLLVEEFDYSIHRGRIAKLVIDRESWTITDSKIILDLKTHLSFPMIWRENEHVYVCPENYQSGGWNLYEYKECANSLEFIKQILPEKLTDATIFKDGTDYYVLSTYEPTPNGSKLTLWKSDSLFGDFSKIEEKSFSENIARNAGAIFSHEGKLLRPAQECNKSYGHAISFQTVSINKGQFEFQEEFRYYSTHPKYQRGTHTFNTYKGLAVIDVHKLRFSFLGGLYVSFKNLLVKLHLKRPFEIK
ncbi:hypothetical protein B7982_10715 [Fibrobacter sp. UWB2]|uniref:glucosamine inositolphosphorylceramide transferase family protein n=1 Tax=Fibrobacter sp. UWB2 TaxID=1964358 RepID=UPI000B528C85|nr:hypothetical protein [Fibrobacter sp. UWB2]OWV21577.1 hypothetical protein B7982_10715 [Fibrobacter sp. UWB2]